MKQIIFYYMKTTFFVGILEFFLKTHILKKLLLAERLLKKNIEGRATDIVLVKESLKFLKEKKKIL